MIKRKTTLQSNPEEVKLAIDLFHNYTRAIYFSQKIIKPDKVDFSLEGEGGDAGVFFPTLPPNHKNRRVWKISFASNNSKEGHPARIL